MNSWLNCGFFHQCVLGLKIAKNRAISLTRSFTAYGPLLKIRGGRLTSIFKRSGLWKLFFENVRGEILLSSSPENHKSRDVGNNGDDCYLPPVLLLLQQGSSFRFFSSQNFYHNNNDLTRFCLQHRLSVLLCGLRDISG